MLLILFIFSYYSQNPNRDVLYANFYIFLQTRCVCIIPWIFIAALDRHPTCL